MIVKNGYVSLEVLNPELIYDWIRNLFDKYLILDKLIDKNEYHTTLQYSKGKSLDSYEVINYIYNIDLSKSELKLFDSKVDKEFKYALVLKLDSQELQSRFLYGKALGATSDYDTYQPHITLAYLKYDVENKFLLEKIDGVVRLGNESVSDLDTEYKPK